MLKAANFLCFGIFELLLLPLLLPEEAQVATSVIGRNLRCYSSANQQSRFQTSSSIFFLFLVLFLMQRQEEAVFKEGFQVVE